MGAGRHRLPFGLTFALAENAAKTVCSFGLTPKLRACTRWTAAEPGGPSRPTTARWKRAASSMRRASTPTRCTTWPTRRTHDHHGPAEITSCLTTAGRHGAVFQLPGKYGKGRAGHAHGPRQPAGRADGHRCGRRRLPPQRRRAWTRCAQNPGWRSRISRCARPSRALRACAPRHGMTFSSADRARLCGLRGHRVPGPVQRPGHRRDGGGHRARQSALTISPILTRHAGHSEPQGAGFCRAGRTY